MIDGQAVRPAYAGYREWFDAQDQWRMEKQSKSAELLSPHRHHLQRLWRGCRAGAADPLRHDPAHRDGDEWKKLSVGIEQRVRAINAFLHDLYHKREIVKAGKLPERLLAQNEAFLPQMVGFTPPGEVYTYRRHRSGAHRAR
jgi:uncharacterized circularly permuted ATP-grasp superfamily protein